MKEVGDHLAQEGFEFLSVNSELKKDPQFVCLKEKKLHFYSSQRLLISRKSQRFRHSIDEARLRSTVSNTKPLPILLEWVFANCPRL